MERTVYEGLEGRVRGYEGLAKISKMIQAIFLGTTASRVRVRDVSEEGDIPKLHSAA